MSTLDDRREYQGAPLNEAGLPAEPGALFKDWLAAAEEAGVPDANAMTLAAVDPDGRPGARIVLLKAVDERGFVFYTSYTSRKGRALAANPRAALVFFWSALERQVQVEGAVAKIPEEESDEYFRTRPREAQLGAWASPQSEVIENRALLKSRLAEAEAKYPAGEVPRPPFWGGYRLTPDTIEFWQGREFRLNDRIRYTREGKGWKIERLAP